MSWEKPRYNNGPRSLWAKTCCLCCFWMKNLEIVTTLLKSLKTASVTTLCWHWYPSTLKLILKCCREPYTGFQAPGLLNRKWLNASSLIICKSSLLEKTSLRAEAALYSACFTISGFPGMYWFVLKSYVCIESSIHTHYILGMYWVCIWFVLGIEYKCMYWYVWYVLVCICKYLQVFVCIMYGYVWDCICLYCMYWYVLHVLVCICIGVYWFVSVCIVSIGMYGLYCYLSKVLVCMACISMYCVLISIECIGMYCMYW